jgi:predicted nucleic acid-binding protein
VLDLIGSEAVAVEVAAGATLDQRAFVDRVFELRPHKVPIGEGELSRSNRLVTVGFRAFDALHIACAEAAHCDVLLTTDDKLVRHAKRNREALNVEVANPLIWLSEYFDNEHGLSNME